MHNNNQVNPKDFIITRKRKKYKFALFLNNPLCFELDEWDCSWCADVVEIGAGTALFTAQLAEKFPGKNFVAIDVKADRLQKGASYAQKNSLLNVRFLRARADQVDEIFKPQSLEQIWVTFPDPFPKKRSSGRRLTHDVFLKKYQKLLKKDCSLYFKTDNQDLFKWSLERLVANKWYLQEISFDLHETELNDDYKIKTSYEIRWLNEGLTTCFVKALPQPTVNSAGAHSKN